MKISTTYQGDMRFASEGPVSVVMDAAEAANGRGEAPTPKQMVLHGLAGCTGMDVAAILKKKKVAYDRFTIEVEAEQTAHHPKTFREIHLTYRFVADPDDRPKIERAIELSRENFCGVSAMLEKSAAIESTLEIIPRNQ